MADTDIVGAEQYLRKINLVVYDTQLNGLDLSDLRIKFSVKRADTETPNAADIRVYNLSKETALSILINLSPTERQPNRGRVILQAGYQGNYGVIFQGNIKQIILGRESATDTFIDIVAGDGDRAYNFAVVNATLAKGSTQIDQVNAAVTAMSPKGVTAGHLGIMPPEQLPRGKVMYGNARNYLRDVAQSTKKTWSIQDEKITFVPLKSYLPGERVVLTSKTGLIGTPQQTNVGVNVKCLLNPLIQIGGRVDISEATVSDFKIDLTKINSAANIPAPQTADGVYYVLVVEHSGDTRGIEWYSSLICLYIDPSSNPFNSVQVGFG
mgnify:CR=1 FL=1